MAKKKGNTSGNGGAAAAASSAPAPAPTTSSSSNKNNNKQQQQQASSEVTYDIETRMSNTTVPGFLTFDNRFPLFDTILPHKVRTFFPRCSFQYSIAMDEELEPQVRRIIPKGMILIYCSITGPEAQAAKALASVEHAMGLQYNKSARESCEFFIEASKLFNLPPNQKFTEQQIRSAIGNSKRAPETLAWHVSFVRKKECFFCTTFYLPEEDKTRPSVPEMKGKIMKFLTTTNVPKQQLRQQQGNNNNNKKNGAAGVIYDDDDYRDDSDYTSGDDSSSSDDDSSSSSSSDDDDSDAVSRSSDSSSDAEEERNELKKKADASKKKKADGSAVGGRSNNYGNSSDPPSFKNSLIPYEEMQRVDRFPPAQALDYISRTVEQLDNRGTPTQFPLQWYSFLYYCENAYCRHRLAQWEMQNIVFSPHSQLADALLIRLPSEEVQARLGIKFPPFSERRPSVGVGDTVVVHIPTEGMILEAQVYAVFPRELGIVANDEVRFSESSGIKYAKERPKEILMRIVQTKTPVHITFDSTPFGFRCSALSAAAQRGDRAYDFYVNPNGNEVYHGTVTPRDLSENAKHVPDDIRNGTLTFKSRGQLSDTQARIVGFMVHPIQGRHELAINGPPGTGKTEVLARAIHAILEKDARARILVASTSHAAVDNLFTRCLFLALGRDAKKYKDRQGRDTAFRKNFMRFYRSRKMPLSVPKHVLPFTNLFPMVAADELTETSKNKFDEDLAEQMMPAKRVVFTNITAVNKLRHWRQQFTHVIIDEAQQAALVEGFLALEVLNTNHPTHQMILAGDTEQIKPHILFPKARQWLEQSVLSCANKNSSRFVRLQLEESFRATDELASVQSAIFYKGKLRAANAQGRHDAETNQRILQWGRTNLRTEFPIPFIHIAGTETTGDSDSSKADNMKERSAMTYSNPEEITCVANVVSSMLQAGISPNSIVVLTNFKTQRKAIQNRLDISHRKGVIRVTSLEEFQGQEADIVIISLVRNQRDENFLSKDELNTIVSRQRILAVIIGDGNMVKSAGSKKWNQLLETVTNPQHHGALNYDYDQGIFVQSPTFDLQISSQNHTLNIKEFKPQTRQQKQILFKEFKRAEILANPSNYFVGRVRWFDASRLASYVESSDQHRFLVASNRFTSAIDVKLDMATTSGGRKFFTVPGDVVALIVDGMEDRVAPLARNERATKAILPQSHACWPMAPHYHYGSRYARQSPYQIVRELTQQLHAQKRGGGGGGGRNHHNSAVTVEELMPYIPDEDVDVEIMTGSSYVVREDDDNIFSSCQQPAGLPVCILRYAKLPPLLCEVKLKVAAQQRGANAGQVRRYWSEANPVDKRFPGLPFDESHLEDLLKKEEVQDSKVIRFWCEMIRPPLNNNGQQQPQECKGTYTFYRPVSVERHIPVTEEPDMRNVRFPASTIFPQLPLCNPSQLQNQAIISRNKSLVEINNNEIRFISVSSSSKGASAETYYVGFSLFDPTATTSSSSNQHNNSNNTGLAPGSEFASNNYNGAAAAADFGGFGFGFGGGVGTSSMMMNNNNNDPSSSVGGGFGFGFGGGSPFDPVPNTNNGTFANPQNQNQNQQSSSSSSGANPNTLTGKLRVGIHIPLVNDLKHEDFLFQNGVTPANHRPIAPTGGEVDVLSIYTDIRANPSTREWNCQGDTFFAIEKAVNFQVTPALQEGLTKLARWLEDDIAISGQILNANQHLKPPAVIAAYFADHRGAETLCSVMPSQALLVRRHVRQDNTEGVELADQEWYVSTMDVKESSNNNTRGGHNLRSAFVNVFGQNEDYNGMFTMTRVCNPQSNLGALIVQRQMMIVSKIRSQNHGNNNNNQDLLDATEKMFLKNSRDLAAWLNALSLVRSEEDFE